MVIRLRETKQTAKGSYFKQVFRLALKFPLSERLSFCWIILKPHPRKINDDEYS